VPPAAAGQAATVFAGVYAVGAPLLLRAARRARPERLLLGALSVFAIGNAATATAPSLIALFGARLVAAAGAGVFTATAAAVAASAVAPRRRGRALSVVVSGGSAAAALGVPLGTVVGAVFDWRTTFYAVVVLTLLITLATWVDARPRPPPADAIRRSGAPVRRSEVLLTLATTMVWASGSFTFFTYVGVVLHDATGVGAVGLAAFLLLFGLAGIGGATVAGRLTDARGPRPTLVGGLALVAVALAGVALGTTVASRTAAIATTVAAIAAYGFGTWSITPPQQFRLLESGGDQRLLVSLNSSVLYAGVALGSGLGGAVLASGAGTTVVCVLAAGLEVVALSLVALGYRPG